MKLRIQLQKTLYCHKIIALQLINKQYLLEKKYWIFAQSKKSMFFVPADQTIFLTWEFRYDDNFGEIVIVLISKQIGGRLYFCNS